MGRRSRSACGTEPVADAAITAVPGVVLSILTADCMPVLFCAQDGSEIGAAHAGWRGLAAGVLERYRSRAMRTPPSRLILCIVALGPAIAASSYEVGDLEVRDAFLDHDKRFGGRVRGDPSGPLAMRSVSPGSSSTRRVRYLPASTAATSIRSPIRASIPGAATARAPGASRA